MSQQNPQEPNPLSLPTKIQQFIEVDSCTSAYQQRSYAHQSLVNSYVVATFLEEANQSVPPLKRNAALRDLAQRLLLWPGDITMELQRDALKAVELLESYVKGSLDAEVKFVEGFELERKMMKAGYEVVERGAYELATVRDDALRDLKLLNMQLKKQILDGQDEGLEIGEFELHDLTPFIPGFTSSRIGASSSGKARKLPASVRVPPQQKDTKTGKMNTDRTETLILVEQFQARLNDTLEELKASVAGGDIFDLKDKESYLKDMRMALDGIELKLGSLTRKEKRVDWFA
ncbi:hypothetical protein DL95DRAFT_455117 [Leptodontidium sp. 2 PMI_412]|nr:hypothetical protein DL95DRAFT_455117 [Leptodontidium sp. 2 PMI_412]